MKTVVWVDKDHMEIPSLMGLVRKEYNVEAYATPDGVLDRIKSGVDLVVMEPYLPPGSTYAGSGESLYNGVPLLRDIRAHSDVPVIICTTTRNPVLRQELKQIGIQDYMTKPVRPSLLATEVKRILG